MNHQDIVNALNTLTPGAKWTLQGDSLSGLVWLDQDQDQPTTAEITAAITTYIPPITQIQQIATLQSQVATLQSQVATLQSQVTTLMSA